MNRRVEILEVQEFEGEAENEPTEKVETIERPQIPMVVYPGQVTQVPSHYPTMHHMAQYTWYILQATSHQWFQNYWELQLLNMKKGE